MEDVPISQRQNQETFVAEDVGNETYTKMPVTDYGLAMLQQMGWSESRGIGRATQNQLVRPIEFIPRHHRQGLGADPVPIKKGPGGESVAQTKNLVSKTGKNYNYIGDELVEKRKYLQKNDRVSIEGGQHRGLQGIAVTVNEEQNECFVELDNEQVVRCKIDHVVPQYLLAAEKSAGGGGTGAGSKEHNDDNSKKSQAQREDSKEKLAISDKSKKIKKSDRDDERSTKKRHKLRWVRAHARVRVISKEYRSGRFYNVKVVVHDILDKYRFSVLTHKGEVLDDLTEDDVETVMPELEKRVIVLAPKDRRGAIGVLKERNKKRNEVIVQLEDDLQFLTCTQDDVAEYCA